MHVLISNRFGMISAFNVRRFRADLSSLLSSLTELLLFNLFFSSLSIYIILDFQYCIILGDAYWDRSISNNNYLNCICVVGCSTSFTLSFQNLKEKGSAFLGQIAFAGSKEKSGYIDGYNIRSIMMPTKSAP